MFYLEGAQAPTALFDPNGPYTYCRLCGDIFQCLTVPEPQNTYVRQSWAVRHSSSHSKQEHDTYNKSNYYIMPEAQIKLAPFGIISLEQSDEVRIALLESKPQLDNIQGLSGKELRSVL